MSATSMWGVRRTDALAGLEVALLNVALADRGRPDGAPHSLALLDVALADRGRVDGTA